MNRTLAAAILLTASTFAAHAQNKDLKDDLFAGTEMFNKNATSVTEINLGPDRLGEVDGKSADRAHATLLNVVRTYSYDKPGMFRMEDVDVFRNKLNSGDWTCSVHTREMKSGDSTDVCNKKRTDDLRETAIITVTRTSLTFIHTIRKRSAAGSTSGVIVNGDHVQSFGGDDALLQMPALKALDEAKLQRAINRLNALEIPAMQQRLRQAEKALDSAHGEHGVVRDLVPAEPQS